MPRYILAILRCGLTVPLIASRWILSWILLLVTFATLALLYSWWFVIGVVLLAFSKFILWRHYSSRPWRKVHYPMMVAHAGACGQEAVEAEHEGRDFDHKAVLGNMLRSVYPDLLLVEAVLLVEQEFSRCEDFYDKHLVKQFLIEKKGADADMIDPMLEDIRKAMRTSDNRLMALLIIASVIEEQFSALDRGEYMYEVFSGNAN